MAKFVIVFVCICFGITQASYAPISLNETVGCVELTNQSVIVQIGTMSIINQTNFEVEYNLVPDKCIYRFVITQIEIQVGTNQIPGICLQEENVNISEYLVTSNFRNLKTITRLNNNNNNEVNMTIISLEIQPILAEELKISRELKSNENYCVSYGLSGYSLTTVTVLSYAISHPMIDSEGDRGFDDTYTGWCNEELCYGGKGQLMDGIIGGTSDNSQSFNIVGWRCFSDGNTGIVTPCTFKLKIYLTGSVNVSEIVFYGFQTETLILPPRINIALYNISISPDVAMEIMSSTYKVNIPIGVVTDMIDIEMVVMEQTKLVLSEVEVFSEAVNIGPLGIGYKYSIINKTTTTTMPTTTQTTSTTTTTINSTSATIKNENCDYSVIYAVFSLIVIVQFLLLLLLSACCIYTTIKYSEAKKTSKLSTNVNQTRNESEYSKAPDRNNSMYATIGSLAGPSSSNNRRGTDERNVMIQNKPIQEEFLIPGSPKESLRSGEYQNQASVSMEASTSPYNITDNVLYGANSPAQMPSTVYGGIEKFSQYDKIKHK